MTDKISDSVAGKSAPPFTVVLIKPSKYDDDGYVVRHVRGVLPSNTLAAIHSLTRDVVKRNGLGEGIEVRTLLYDETVHRIDPKRIARRALRGGGRAAICLCAVQSNQFPRAADLALQFRDLDLPVLIGGFHTSGIMELFPDLTPELQEMVDHGVTIVHGEVEEAWAGLLRDAYLGQLKPRYDIKERPDLSEQPIPELDRTYMKRFAYPNLGTIDAGRGCPFNCSFCTIINVQGRKMRTRSAVEIKRVVRDNWKKKVDYYFFTDDNFSRNPNWEEIFDVLIELREEENIRIDFMIQVDTLAWKIPHFIEKAARAGSTQVFIGMESIRPENLKAAGKTQNKAKEYTEMIDLWHHHGIACHVGYILGFPADTPESIAEDVHALIHEIHIDQVSFFMLTPLPGSRDHLEMVHKGAWMHSDLNRFDSFHPVMDHPNMSAEQWSEAYQQCWKTFYSFDTLRQVLSRANPHTYWGLFKNYLWYRAAMIEDAHPMITGFLRLKDRTQRRRGYAVESRFAHLRRRIPEVARQLRAWVTLFLEMEELWLQTRHVTRPIRRHRFRVSNSISAITSGISQAAREQMDKAGAHLETARGAAREQMDKAGAHLETARGAAREQMIKAGAHLEHARGAARRSLASMVARLHARLNPLSFRGLRSRQHLADHWRSTRLALLSGRFWRLRPLRSLTNLVRDVNCTTRFGLALIATRIK
ncbi:MAG: radical SAM protein [Acidobacteria bacterium]|nr:radical SAM protein [Acidobacteriota bacterium]